MLSVGALFSPSGLCIVFWGCPDPKYHSMQGGWCVGGPKTQSTSNDNLLPECVNVTFFDILGKSTLVSLLVKEHWLKNNLLLRLIYFIMGSTFFELLVLGALHVCLAAD